MAKLVKKFVKVTSDNECYETFKNDTLQITHTSNEGNGYDEAMYPEMLCSFKNTRTGEEVPCSLYKYEFEFEIVQKPKPRKTAKSNFYEMARDHIVQNGFTFIRGFDMETYEQVKYNKGNVNISFPLPKKGFKEKIFGVYFQLEDPHAKQFSNGRWKFNFLGDSKLDKNYLFDLFVAHFETAMDAL